MTRRVDHLYIVPPTDYPDGHVYVKLGATRRNRTVLSAEQRRRWMAGTQHEADLDWLKGLLLGVLPGLQVDAWLTKPCLIPETPTKLPYVEIVEPGCVMAVGSNGYAAKSADAIGALAAGLVLNGTWTDPDLDQRSFEVLSAGDSCYRSGSSRGGRTRGGTCCATRSPTARRGRCRPSRGRRSAAGCTCGCSWSGRT